MSKAIKRSKYLTRWAQLKAERASWIYHWKEISDNIMPRAGRFFLQDRNKGTKRHNNILDSTPTRALYTLAAGMMGGMTSPARPWFRLASSNYMQNDSAAVRQWMATVTNLMLEVFQKSNTYRVLHQSYLELGAFGTAAFIVVPDYDSVIHCYPLTAGEYAVATDYKGKVNTIYREFQKTVHELVGEFGYENCSISVRNMFDNGTLDAWVTVVHLIEPRADRDINKKDAKNKPYRSVYFEQGSDDGHVLRESGFDRFPAIVPRWQVFGGDIYGSSPAMDCLGDMKQLQHEQLRKAQAIDYKITPPLQVPAMMKGREVDMLPKGTTFVDKTSAGNAIRTLFDVNLDMTHLLGDIADVRDRINKTFYADLFLMISQDDPRMTATEVMERKEEKMLMLGSVIERLHDEMLDPLIDITFNYMLEAGVIPQPPDELAGEELSVEFISMLAQAQKAIGTNSIDRFVNSLGAVAQFKPEVLDKLDADQWADTYSDLLGVDPRIVIDDATVQATRQQRAQAQQAQAQAEQLQQASQAAKNLGSVNTSQPNGLTDVMDMFSGYSG